MISSASDLTAGDSGTTRATLYVIAAAAVGQAIQLRDGLYQTWSFPWLTLAVVAALLALFLKPHSTSDRGIRDSGAAHFLIATMVTATLLWPAWALVRSASRDAYWAEQRLGGWFFGITSLVAVCCGVVYARRRRPLPADLRLSFPWLIGVVVAYQLVQLATFRVGSEWAHVHGYRAGGLFYGCLAVAAGAFALVLLRRQWLTHVAFFMAIGAFATMGAWTIRWQKPPFMDVWFNQKCAIDHYLEGHNPYTGRYPFIFAEYDAIPPGSGPLAATTFENLGFAYTPWSFWIELPAHRWAGDLRYALLACMIVTAVLIAYLRPGPVGPLVAMLYLFTPRAFFVLESAWTEPTVTFPLALLLFVALRWPRLVPVFLGVFLVSKQYLVFAILPGVLFLGRFGWPRVTKLFAIAAVVGGLVSVPLIVWDFSALSHGRWHDVMMNVRAFIHCDFGVVSQTVMGDDVLSYMGWVRANFGVTLSTVVPFCLAAGVTPLLLWRCPREAGGYAAAVGTVYLLFFSTAHLVRCNYYYLILACFAAAAALSWEDGPSTQRAARAMEKTRLVASNSNKGPWR